MAHTQAYYEKDAQTEDAIRCGNLHLNRQKWEADSLEWLLGGAYGDLSGEVATLAALPSLTLWGRQDEVIPPAATVPKLAAALPAVAAPWRERAAADSPTSIFRWVEDSGHTPHLEQPGAVATAIAAFVRGETVGGSDDVADVLEAAARWDQVRGVADKAAAAVKQLGSQAVTKAKELLEDK